jgi:2,4-dienoyl-CoA reductase-like NADH-dependent reductase (Old Yellow Enzyme family)
MATNDGIPTEQQIEFYSILANGGTGLIITGQTSINRLGRCSDVQLCLYDDSQVAGHKKLVDAVHDYSEVKIAPQLNHVGRCSFNPTIGINPVGPSPIQIKPIKKTPAELTIEEIRRIIKNFVDACRRAYESGYDLVQLQAAHNYLLSSFLSPYTNKRKDEYGGDTQSRTKILVDIYNQVKDEMGKKFPIALKLQTNDYIPEGLNLEEGLKIAKLLADVGYSAIEPTGGGTEYYMVQPFPYPSAIVTKPEEENYFLPAVEKLKEIKKECPLILMGGVRDPFSAEKILNENIANFISISRPLIYEPDLPNRWKSGDLSPPLCTSCNQCYTTIFTPGPIDCPIKKRAEKRRMREEKRRAQQ